MQNVRYKFSIDLDASDFNLLLKSLSFYNLSSAFLNYGEDVESCEELRHKIFRNVVCYENED